MKTRVKATGEIVEIVGEGIQNSNMVMSAHGEWFTKDELDIVPLSWKPFEPTYWQKLEHQYAGMAMQGLLSSGKLNIIMDNSDVLPEGIAIVSRDFAHALVKKVRYEENPKELEGLKKELEALEIEKTILENKIKLLKEERK